MAITTTELLAGVKRRISMPASQILLEDEDILAFADDVIRSKITPLLEASNGEFFVTTKQVSLVASTSEYDIPYRAVGRALREVKLVDTGDTFNVRNLTKIEIEEIQFYLNEALLSGFYLKGDRIRLVPDVSASYSGTDALEIWYRLAPSRLTVAANVCTVVSATTTVVTVDAVPSTITSLTPIDFIQGRSGNRIYDIDVTPSATSSTNLTFASGSIPTTLTAGDYIALAGYAPVLTMIPDEAYPYLETCTAIRALKSFGDYDGARELAQDEREEENALKKLVEPRVDGEPTVIINRNGLFRGNKFGQRRWLYEQ